MMLILGRNVLRFDLLTDNSTVITQQYINPALFMGFREKYYALNLAVPVCAG